MKLVLNNVVLPQEENMTAVHLDIQVDIINKIVHLLDTDHPKGITLTNSISDDLMEQVQSRIPISILNYRVWTYHTDGISCEYSNGKFKYKSLDDSLIPPEFSKVLKDRRRSPLYELIKLIG